MYGETDTTRVRPREARTSFVLTLIYISYISSTEPTAYRGFARMLNDQIRRRAGSHGIPGILECNEAFATRKGYW